MKSLLLLLAVVLVPSVFAQQPSIRLDADATIFRYDSTRQLWEWCYAFPDTSLVYKQRDGRSVGEMYFRISIKDTAGTLVKSEQWIVANTATVASSRDVRNLIGVKQFALAPGKYRVDCVAADMANRQDSLSRSFLIAVTSPITDRLAMSEILLASSIEPAEEGANPAYTKGSMTVIPNPSAQYILPEVSEDSLNMGVLLPYYFEVYNAHTFSPAGINLHFTVLDAARRPLLSFNQKQNTPTDGLPIYGNLPLDTLASGVYYFQVNITDVEASAVIATGVRKFYVLNSAKLPTFSLYSESQDYEMSEFSTMGQERVQEEYEKIQPLITSHEQSKYGLLTDLTAQRKFLYVYWKQRDPDPAIPGNKAREDFESLINYANTYFSTLQTPGWRTDRGRVIRQYGKPDKVDVAPYSPEAKPYATWYYYAIQGGVQFCFVELNGVDYTLVHSTAKNELSEPEWYERFAEIMGAAQFSR